MILSQGGTRPSRSTKSEREIRRSFRLHYFISRMSRRYPRRPSRDSSTIWSWFPISFMSICAFTRGGREPRGNSRAYSWSMRILASPLPLIEFLTWWRALTSLMFVSSQRSMKRRLGGLPYPGLSWSTRNWRTS